MIKKTEYVLTYDADSVINVINNMERSVDLKKYCHALHLNISEGFYHFNHLCETEHRLINVGKYDYGYNFMKHLIMQLFESNSKNKLTCKICGMVHGSIPNKKNYRRMHKKIIYFI